MERRLVLACLVLAASAVAGCGSAAPAATVVPQASDPAADPTPVPGAVTAPPLAEGQLELKAINIDFEPKELVAPTGPVALTFHNLDAGVPHNVAINDAGGSAVFVGEIVTGPADMDIVLGDLSAGWYTFVCTVHPTMTGTLTVLP